MRKSLICFLFGLSLVPGVGSAARVTLSPEQPSPGELFLVTVDEATTVTGVRAEFGDREFQLWPNGPDGWQGLVAVDRDRLPGLAPLVLTRESGKGRRTFAEATVTIAPREYPEQQLTVKKGMVDLSPEDQARAARENRLIRKTLGRTAPDRLWRSPFAMPLEGPITSTFGVRRVYNSSPRGYHSGLDVAAPRGTPVLAAAEGTVVLVGEFFYTGRTVFVDHGLGLYTAYFHLDAVGVTDGQTLGAGDEIGRVGSTGRSTGPHLHWGVYLSGRKTDPLTLLRAVGAGVGGGESP